MFWELAAGYVRAFLLVLVLVARIGLTVHEKAGLVAHNEMLLVWQCRKVTLTQQPTLIQSTSPFRIEAYAPNPAADMHPNW